MKFITTEKAFNKANEKCWKENASFWATQSARNEKTCEMSGKLLNIVRGMMKIQKKPMIIDAGCGHGWIYDDLQTTHPNKFKYIGLDYTLEFITSNSERTKNKKNASFVQYDLTSKKLPEDIVGIADIVINFFNLIEVWNMKAVFKNMHSMMKPNGTILIATTDPLSSIASLSVDNKDYNKNLKMYMERKGTMGWGEEITLGGKKKTGRTFYTAAHPVSEYITEAAKYGMYLDSIEEFRVHEVTVPQVSLIMKFVKRQK
jgi:2-polyprenyl-3-methyl-5-hydroxy-6-metoxy-1,4-benzoquinol methylase